MQTVNSSDCFVFYDNTTCCAFMRVSGREVYSWWICSASVVSGVAVGLVYSPCEGFMLNEVMKVLSKIVLLHRSCTAVISLYVSFYCEH